MQRASVRNTPQPDAPAAGRQDVGLCLIGPGNVGSRILEYMSTRCPENLHLLGVADSTRMALAENGFSASGWREQLKNGGSRSDVGRLAKFIATQPLSRRILVDATASKEVAARHADWLAAGVDIVTANKWALAGELAAYRRLQTARASGNGNYWSATTVGAGLPLVDTVAALRRAGDRIECIEGVFSGTMAYLTHGVRTGRSFSTCVVDAHRLGLTEPDPRVDLSGLDVARKLVITARSAGIDLELDQVQLQSLVPASLEAGPVEHVLTAGKILDDHWASMAAASLGHGPVLQHIGRVELLPDGATRARVGLYQFPTDHPCAGVAAGENLFRIQTESYREYPIVIRGPGAGRDVTALQVWAEIVKASGSVTP